MEQTEVEQKLQIVESPLYQEARNYALRKHIETNHLYDGKFYKIHLDKAVNYALHYLYLLPADAAVRVDVVSAVWCHDLIEDCRVSYNDLKNATNERIAELCYAVTNEKGRTRKERAGVKYYEGILDTPFAPFVKLCDRLANVSYAAGGVKRRMIDVYRAEQFAFREYLMPTEEYKPMWEELDRFLAE